MNKLAKRAVACKHWRWMPGMLDEHGNRYVAEGRYPRRSVLPDLTDPATLGCLLALVREAWDVGYGENKYAYIAVNPPVTPHMDEPWSVVVCDHNGEWPFGFDGDTEAEALIEALEAAP